MGQGGLETPPPTTSTLRKWSSGSMLQDRDSGSWCGTGRGTDMGKGGEAKMGKTCLPSSE